MGYVCLKTTLCKVFNVWPKKYRGVTFDDIEEWVRKEKLTCGLENDMKNMVNFYRSTWKSQNWDFDETL